MTDKTTGRERLKYWFDNYISRSRSSLFVLLIAAFLLFLVLMVLLRLVLSVLLPAGLGGADGGPVETAITAFLQTFDPGFMAGDMPSSRWYMGAAIVAGVGGIILVAVLIAFMNNAVEARFAMLRRGQSTVVEEGHTLILGWEEQRIVEIIRELVMANEDSISEDEHKRHKVVILAEQDKEYMDNYLKRHLPENASKRASRKASKKFVTRRGDPSSGIDLATVSASTAKSAIILSECSYAASDEKKEQADARVMMRLLALDRCIQSSGEPDGCRSRDSEEFPVVVALFRRKARTTSGFVQKTRPKTGGFVGVGPVVAPDVKNVLAMILLQTSRSVGLSVVYDELFSFRGAEFYTTPIGDIPDKPEEGLSFRDASDRLAHGIAVGIRTRDKDRGNDGVTFNPDFDETLGDTDQLIVLASDDSKIGFGPLPDVGSGTGDSQSVPEVPEPEKQLVIGWGPKTTRLLDEYLEYVDRRSTVQIMKRAPENRDPAREAKKRYRGSLRVSVLDDDPTEPSTWRERNPYDYSRIIILSDGDRGVPADVVDAKTITILLLLRKAMATWKGKGRGNRPTIVTELVESDNQVLVPDVGVHDFVISSRIVSRLFAQLSEDPTLHEIYMSLFRAKGSEIYIKPISRYVEPTADGSKSCRFGDLMRAANEHDEICIGVKIGGDGTDSNGAIPNYGVTLIPDTDESFDLEDIDSLVVLSKHATEVPE